MPLPFAFCLIQIFRVVFHPCFLQKIDEFLPKCPFPMMLLLVGDVFANCLALGRANRESAVTLLPTEI